MLMWWKRGEEPNSQMDPQFVTLCTAVVNHAPEVLVALDLLDRIRNGQFHCRSPDPRFSHLVKSSSHRRRQPSAAPFTLTSTGAGSKRCPAQRDRSIRANRYCRDRHLVGRTSRYVAHITRWECCWSSPKTLEGMFWMDQPRCGIFKKSVPWNSTTRSTAARCSHVDLQTPGF